MNIIVAGQRIVTQAEYFEAAIGFDVEPLDVEHDLVAGGLASRDALESFLADCRVENDTDREDAAYYAGLLRRMPRELRSRKPVPAALVAAELEVVDNDLGFEDDEVDIYAEWTAADYDSYEVLAGMGRPDPVAAVTRARAPRTARPALRLVPTIAMEVAA
ncbi:hypothetical protein [Streptomyces sp. NRRL S-241]|uniref:hypothetical protein n=1 Tax=Streptomyces sp. NRRL S-241 TaxID=1463896 RepID=UPI0004BF376A|nr:hypothetical protein [Streptomyces sp. NRRL S-241]